MPRLAATTALLLGLVVAGATSAADQWQYGRDATPPRRPAPQRAALVPGMSKNDVARLLGAPKRMDFHDDLEIWIYDPAGPLSPGMVTFRDDRLETTGP